MKTILAFFGYVKIPQAAVQLSFEQEVFLEKLQKLYDEKSQGNFLFAHHLKIQKTLTLFLRSGRLDI